MQQAKYDSFLRHLAIGHEMVVMRAQKLVSICLHVVRIFNSYQALLVIIFYIISGTMKHLSSWSKFKQEKCFFPENETFKNLSERGLFYYFRRCSI